MAPRDPTEAPETGPLTARQRRIVDFIATTVRERGYPPTVREIGEAVGLTSSSSVHAQLANLERKGLLTKDATKPRAMSLSEPMADEHVEEYVTVPHAFVSGNADHFALRVAGDSMIGAGILDGDLVVIRSQA